VSAKVMMEEERAPDGARGKAVLLASGYGL